VAEKKAKFSVSKALLRFGAGTMKDVPAKITLEVSERGRVDLLVMTGRSWGSYVDGGEVTMQGREVVVPLIAGCESLYLCDRFDVIDIGRITQLYAPGLTPWRAQFRWP